MLQPSVHLCKDRYAARQQADDPCRVMMRNGSFFWYIETVLSCLLMPLLVLLQPLFGLHLQLPLVVQWLLPPTQMHMQSVHPDYLDVPPAKVHTVRVSQHC